MEFGHGLKLSHFLLAEEYINLNHGSFGTVPKRIAAAQQEYFLLQESRPDRWFREIYFDLVKESRRSIAALINASIDDVVMVENASDAVNSILRSVDLKAGDKVLVLSTAYSMVTNTLSWQQQTMGVEVVTVTVEFPVVDSSQIVRSVEEAFVNNSGVKICVFSHISSMPTLIEPVRELTALAHQNNSLVIVDGAHAPGVIAIDVQDIGADYYLGNLHKWMFCPKGTAFMWVSSSAQSERSPQPTIISSSGKVDFVGRFEYTGTRDYTAFPCVPAAVRFIDEELGGLTRVQDYCMTLAAQASKVLTEAWGTALLVPLDMTAYMFNVVLPSQDEEALTRMQVRLDREYNIYMVVASVMPSKEASQKIYFTRLSAQVYLELQDFEQLASLVLQILSTQDSDTQSIRP